MASFEENLTGLELVVERLERGELTLAESIRLFEEGVGLSNACRVELAAAEGKIQVLLEPVSQAGHVQDLTVRAGQTHEDEDDD